MGLPSWMEAAWANKFLEEEDGLVDASALKDSFVGKDLFPGCGEHPSDFTWIAEFFLGLFKKNKKGRGENTAPPTDFDESVSLLELFY